MKTHGFHSLLLLLTVLVLASSAMAQEVCTPEMAKGTYAVTCSGWVSLNPADPTAPLVPFAEQGVVKNELAGGKLVSSARFNESLGGIQLVALYSSKDVVVNPDCTGSVTYAATANGQPMPDVHLEIVALDQGKEMRSFNTVPGVISLCTSKLMSRNTNQ